MGSPIVSSISHVCTNRDVGGVHRSAGDWSLGTNIHLRQGGFRGSTDQLHLTEKFRRVAEDTLEYYMTIDDPTMWSRPWTLMIPLKKTGEGLFEFACHEGNYGLRAILSGARAQERSTR